MNLHVPEGFASVLDQSVDMGSNMCLAPASPRG